MLTLRYPELSVNKVAELLPLKVLSIHLIKSQLTTIVLIAAIITIRGVITFPPQRDTLGTLHTEELRTKNTQ